MERTKRSRGIERAAITRVINVLEGELLKTPVNRITIEVQQKSLDAHYKKLVDLDDKIKDFLLDDASISEATLAEEYEAIDVYYDRVNNIQVKIKTILFPLQPPRNMSITSLNGISNGSPTSQKRKTCRLPKIELKKFAGDLLEWLGWWAQFKKIDDDEDLHDSDKFTYLVQSMTEGSRASDLVISYPQSAENYPKVVKSLKERFGNPKILKQVYVRELIQMILLNRTRGKMSLSHLYDRLESQLRSLESLGVSVDQMIIFLFPMVESSLPEDILVAWQRSPWFGKDGSGENPPKSEIDFLMSFLKQEIENEEQRNLAKGSFFQPTDKKRTTKKEVYVEEDLPTAASLFNTFQKVNCLFCDRAHESRDCLKAQRMTLSEKNEKIKKKGACFICLKTGHMAKECRALVKCPLCQKKHQVLLCPDLSGQNPAIKTMTSLTTVNCTSEVILGTLKVVIKDPHSNKQKVVRALLDSGSQKTYVLQKTTQELKLIPKSTQVVNHVLFGGCEMKNESHCIFQFDLCDPNSQYSCSIQALDQREICSLVPRLPSGPWMTELQKRNIKISDSILQTPVKVEILLGADCLGQLLTGKVIQLDSGLTAIHARFGWTVIGQIGDSSFSNMTMSMISMTLKNASLGELWNLDTIGIRDPVETKTKEETEKVTQEHFQETVRQCSDGRYSVSLPWNQKEVLIPNNKEAASKRLEMTTRKLKVMGKFAEYDEIFKSWEQEGFITKLNIATSEKDNRCHYLPHRPVLKAESRTTPIRPVFDASCRQGRTPSLNDCLDKGPNFLELIPSILLRFRLGNFGVTSDIKKAFLNIEMNEGDRDFLRFLWWENLETNVMCVYRHNRVVFGLNCSPFLLGAVIDLHLKQCLQTDPECSQTLKKLANSFYVDNCVVSLDTLEEVDSFKTEATRLMKKGEMDLRQWEWTRDDKENKEANVLGIKWQKTTDTLSCCPMSNEIPSKVTKRIILSHLHQIFDPLGFLTPVLLPPKILLQRLWISNKHWDAVVNQEIWDTFQAWCLSMSLLLHNFRIPRNCTEGRKINISKCQLHVFSDASNLAYAIVSFLRVESEGRVSVHMLQAKARVKPLKTVTLPRLELLGCVIGARLAISLKSALSLVNVPLFLWTDSTTVLAWIRRNNEWGTFVGNRVREILQLTKEEEWYFVPGNLNPADLPSRGITPAKFLGTRWWEGPEWLKKDRVFWPSREPKTDEHEITKEKKLKTTALTVELSVKPWYIVRNSYDFNLRVVAYILRFRDRLKKTGQTIDHNLTMDEIHQAEMFLLCKVQDDSFDMTRTLIHGIQVFKDTDGLLKVKTKLIHGEDLSMFKLPVLFPSVHPLVTLLIRQIHEFNCHGGIQMVMGILRERFWVLAGRTTVKRVIRTCTVCQRYASKKQDVPVSALPLNRMKTAGAFEVTGIDLARPLLLRNKSKVWFVLFTCGVYRCIHLELVQSLSTEDFIMAFIRFCKRKRRPTTVYTDNGSNFTGAVNLFKTINWKKVEFRTRLGRIQWRFNPPTAPWWGGWWERLIRTIKDLMKRMLGFGKLTYVQLETCLCEVECAMNRRPLTFVSEDSQDLIPLTPAMFLYDLPETQVPETNVLNISSLDCRKKKLDQLMTELRNRFRKEYLGLLIQRGKEKKSKELKIGEIVFIGSDNKKRVFWPMGKIEELILGKDGHCQIAKVKTQHGMLLRPVSRLFRLEIRMKNSIQDSKVKRQKIYTAT